MFTNIDPDTLVTKLGTPDFVLIDVRNDDEVARGFIQSAIHIPLSLLPAHIGQLPAQKSIVFYCHSGVRSAHAADFASSKGFKSVYNLTGGIIAWAKAGLTFVRK